MLQRIWKCCDLLSHVTVRNKTVRIPVHAYDLYRPVVIQTLVAPKPLFRRRDGLRDRTKPGT